MKPTAEIARPILQYLETHPVPDRPLLLCIDGHPATGKSTLAEYLLRRLEGIQIKEDTFLKPLKERLELIDATSDLVQTIVRDFYDHQGVLDEIARLQALPAPPEMIVVDGVFTLDPVKYPKGWDVGVYLYGNQERTTQRRIVREKARWGAKYMPDGDPRSIFPMITDAYDQWAVANKPDTIANIVISID